MLLEWWHVSTPWIPQERYLIGHLVTLEESFWTLWPIALRAHMLALGSASRKGSPHVSTESRAHLVQGLCVPGCLYWFCLQPCKHKSLYFFNNLLIEKSIKMLSSDSHLWGTFLWILANMLNLMKCYTQAKNTGPKKSSLVV